MNLLLLLLLLLQELQEVGNSFARAPKCSWSPIPPPELRGENVHHLTTNGGFVSFGTSSTKFLSVDTRAHGPAVRLQLSSGPAGLRVYIYPSHRPLGPARAGVLSRHVRGKRAAKTAWILLNFQSYVKYHIKVLLPLPATDPSTSVSITTVPWVADGGGGVTPCSAPGATSRAGCGSAWRP